MKLSDLKTQGGVKSLLPHTIGYNHKRTKYMAEVAEEQRKAKELTARIKRKKDEVKREAESQRQLEELYRNNPAAYQRRLMQLQQATRYYR